MPDHRHEESVNYSIHLMVASLRIVSSRRRISPVIGFGMPATFDGPVGAAGTENVAGHPMADIQEALIGFVATLGRCRVNSIPTWSKVSADSG
jgi:hypothetical protein